MTTFEELGALESRQLALRAIMAGSDARASKCAKLGLDFRATYPADLAAYQAANEEFNANEQLLAALKLRLDEEQEEEARAAVEETNN